MWRKVTSTSSVLVYGRPASKNAHRKASSTKSTSALPLRSATAGNGGRLESSAAKSTPLAVEKGKRLANASKTELQYKPQRKNSTISSRPNPAVKLQIPETFNSLEEKGCKDESALCYASHDTVSSVGTFGSNKCIEKRDSRDTVCSTVSYACIHAPNLPSKPYTNALFTRPKPSLLKLSLRAVHGTARTCNIEDIAYGLAHSGYRNVIVMSGAGISTHSGIPDFRTPGTGLYDNLQQYNVPSPESIFDISYFAVNPKPFFALARDLYPGKYAPNLAHYFVRLLQEKSILLRNYTQNIDGLERLAGVVPDRLVEAHGSFDTASCVRCGTKHDPKEIKSIIQQGEIPRCKLKACKALVKPDIVFFGQDLPNRFYSLSKRDFSRCDLLLVMGTSLEVEPFAGLVSLVSSNTPRVLVNKEVVWPFDSHGKRPNDVIMTGDLVESLQYLVKEASWVSDLEQLMGDVGGDPGSVPGAKGKKSEITTPPKRNEVYYGDPNPHSEPSEHLCTKMSEVKLSPDRKSVV